MASLEPNGTTSQQDVQKVKGSFQVLVAIFEASNFKVLKEKGCQPPVDSKTRGLKIIFWSYRILLPSNWPFYAYGYPIELKYKF